MTDQASGTFDVKVTPQTPEENVGDPSVQRLALDKQFHGDLEAVSKGQMLATGNVQGSGGYVAIERINGKLKGRSGTFALQHNGTMNPKGMSLSITVVPDTGTEELTGLTGSMIINIVEGKHFYEFDYSINP